jgi:hypothetical protein
MTKLCNEIVTVLRLIRYTGERRAVEDAVQRSVHGAKMLPYLTITAVTLSDFPEIVVPERMLAGSVDDD